MKISGIMGRTGRGAGTALHRTAREVLVRWDDGTQEVCGVSDAVEDGDVADFITREWHRKVTGWKELVPRSQKPQRPPD